MTAPIAKPCCPSRGHRKAHRKARRDGHTLSARLRHGVVAVVAGGLVAAGLTGCGGDDAPVRSRDAFCSTYTSEKNKFTERYSSVGKSDGEPDGAKIITDLILGFQSLGDAKVIFEKLEQVAPDEIAADVTEVRKSIENIQATLGDQAENAFNPTGLIGATFRGLLSQFQSGGSWQRVGEYVEQNCDAS